MISAPNLLLLMGILVFGAGSSCKALPAEDRGEEIHFGQGGGFTGAVTHYILSQDGRIVSRKAGQADVYLQTLDPRVTRDIFRSFHRTGFDKENFDRPGNLYLFLEGHKGGHLVNQMIWGAGDFSPPRGLADFYLFLMKSTTPKS